MPERPHQTFPIETTAAQRLHLELMKLATFNYFDGRKVVADLEARPHLWRTAIIGNFGTSLELLALRDMNKGVYLVDTLMILSTHEQARALQRLAHTWNPTEVWWLDQE